MSKKLMLVAVTAMLFIAAGAMTGCAKEEPVVAPGASTPAPEAPVAEEPAVPAGAETAVVEGLKIQDLVVGTGTQATSGKTVSVHYTGWLEDGTQFDSSVDSGQPFQFALGAGQVISGWDQGVVGMKIGGKRKLTIAPELGYGAQGAGGAIPPNATLIFDVELLDVR
ncbi:MAG: FKBP-type peptidyl-prolyl cis-trans isomerase [Coriobacteriia bacterium]|nr:FKBP-type peptidyl-prolyl cis-trans isomerase [Coriobacteriia bacterium]